MIYDLDVGRPERPSRPGAHMTAVTVAVVGAMMLLFSALAFGPGQRDRQTPIFTFTAPALPTMPRPTFNTKPVPDWTLVLPPEVAKITNRITNSGFTGLIPNDSLTTTYRLVASNDLVNVSWFYPNEVLPFPPQAPGDAPLRVRGRAANWVVTETTTIIRWLEAEMVFEMSSRTQSVDQLANLANRLR